jgi:hypothetical protein
MLTINQLEASEEVVKTMAKARFLILAHPEEEK